MMPDEAMPVKLASVHRLRCDAILERRPAFGQLRIAGKGLDDIQAAQAEVLRIKIFFLLRRCLRFRDRRDAWRIGCRFAKWRVDGTTPLKNSKALARTAYFVKKVIASLISVIKKAASSRAYICL